MSYNHDVLTATQRARLACAWREGLPAPWNTLLGPAALAYRGGLALRQAAYAWGVLRTRTLPCRVVAVGNLTVGGTGKTPLVELIARRLSGGGRRVVILSRGYGRRCGEAVALVSDGTRVLLTAREAGDEPVLLARRLPGVPVVVGRDRALAGAWAIPRFEPDVLLLDDGFQQRRLHKDVEVVCVDARAPSGCGGLLPRGNLREPMAALARAHLLVLTHGASGVDLQRVVAELRAWAPAAPVAVAEHEAEAVEDLVSGSAAPPESLRGRPVLGFAGIAAPESFRATLAAHGADLRDFVAFPDHHPYARDDIARLETRARAVGAEMLLTTEKDSVRLCGGTMPVSVLRIGLGLRDEDGAWWQALERRLATR